MRSYDVIIIGGGKCPAWIKECLISINLIIDRTHSSDGIPRLLFVLLYIKLKYIILAHWAISVFTIWLAFACPDRILRYP